MNWNTNIVSTNVDGTATPLATAMPQHGVKKITLAFATGECGSEIWGGSTGRRWRARSANLSLLTNANIDYILSTGGAAGTFTCTSDSGFATFLSRWASTHLIGIDFDIEAGQSETVISALLNRILTVHSTSPTLRFSLTLATLANNAGGSTAASLGASAQDSLNAYGRWTLNAVKSVLG